MRIALVGAGMIPIPPPGYGAVEKHIWNLAGALTARGHDVRIVNKVFGDRSLDEYRFAFWARKEIAREPFDVVHLHTPGVATIFSARGPRRFVYTTHSRHWSAAPEKLTNRLGHALEKRAVMNAIETIAVSRLVAGEIERRVHVIPNGVDVARYAPSPGPRTGREAVGLGEVAPHKAWHLAARGAREAGARFTVVGPIRDPAYAKLVEKEGGTLAGPLPEDEMIALLARSDVLLHPSVAESFGMAVVEGMSCGLPVVCSDILSFLVEHGKEGYLVPTKGEDDARAAAIRDAVRRLVADETLRRQMGRAARERAVEKFSWEKVAQQVEAVYRLAVPRP